MSEKDWVGGSRKVQNYADVIYGWSINQNVEVTTWRNLIFTILKSAKCLNEANISILTQN